MKPTSRCVRLLLTLLAPLACLTTASAASSTSYVADGVDVEDITGSTRFYDTGKGLYWEKEGKPYRGAEALYNSTGKNFDFLGELEPRILGDQMRKGAFHNLINDGNSCWYCVGANVIQYWESYYGVFYKGDGELPYGYTYDAENLATLAGTQSLDLHMVFYDNWTQTDGAGHAAGGDAEMAVVWYLATGENVKAGKATYSQINPEGGCAGAYFSEYFTGQAVSREAYYIGGDATDLVSATDFLREAFGFDKDGNRVTYGQIAYVGVLSSRTAGSSGVVGHALTCYGFTVDEDGRVESLFLTNSDDLEYKVYQVYVGLSGEGDLRLYSDAAHTQEWVLLGETQWNICDITYIKTPQALKVMYDEYTRAALTWTGAVGTWSGSDAAKATTEKLPDAQSGWQAYAQDAYYASYYHDGRTVAFTDLADKTDVKLQGALSTPEMQLNNNTKAYTFTGGSGTTLHADSITKQGAADVTFSNVAITAQLMDVDMGALILGKGATLTTRGSGEVDDMGTLQLSGGKASFTGGLDIYSSATLAVTAASQLTTTLNLHDGSALYFNLGSANKTTPPLTLTGNLDVLGACHLTVNGAALTAGQSYILAGVSGSIAGWESITTNCGAVTLNGKQLVLNYAKPATLTWTGGSGTWSASRWDGRAAESDGADVTFAPQSGRADITVVGDVSPNSMHFSRGEYRLIAGEGAGTSGCNTITLGDGASIIATVPLTGGNITMESGSRLTMSLTTPESEVTGLEMAPGSSLVFQGATRYTVDKAGALAGSIDLQGTTVLVLGSSMDTELYGSYTGDAGTAIVLMNSSEDHPVTFYMGQGSPGYKGSVTIGTGDDAPLTTLRMGYAARNFTITENGELSLRGTGEINGFMDGTGTLTIERDAIYQLAPGGKVSFSKDVALNVAGIATAGTAEHPLKAALQDRIAVSGSLTVYYQAEEGKAPLTLNELLLNNGGAYTLVHLERSVDSLHTIDKLAVDGSGTISNTIQYVPEETQNPAHMHTITVNSLSGSGTLDLDTDSDLYVTKLAIRATAAEGYHGDITIRNPHYYRDNYSYYTNYDHGQVVEMASGSVDGAIRLVAHGMTSDEQVTYGLAAFGVGGNIAVGGIDDSESSKNTYLYSGYFPAASAAINPESMISFDSRLTKVKHTLTLTGAGSYDFHGKVYAWLSLVKQGTGTQTFSGNTSGFDGALRVDAGRLVFGNAIDRAGGVVLNGGTLELHGGTLSGLRGAASGAGGTLALGAGDYAIDLTGATGNYSVQLNGAAATVTGAGALGTSIASAGTSGITMQSGSTLALAAPITNTGTLSLAGAYDVSSQQLYSHIDAAGTMGTSGFALDGDCVALVTGGTTVNNGATVTHGKQTLTLGSNGIASTGTGVVDYSAYLLTGTDTASVSAINKAAGAALKSIDVKGGTLTVDTATNLLNATGGKVSITQAVTVGGSAKDTAITATAGTLNTALSGTTTLAKSGTGTLTISRANTHSGKTTVSGGTLKAANKDALGTGAVQLSGGTLEIAANGFSNTITSSGTSGITVDSPNTLVLANALSNQGTLTLKGAFDASALKLTQGETTHVDVNGKTGASGFSKSGVTSVSIVSGGTTVNGGTTIIHNGLESGTLTLGSDGKAVFGGVVDYSAYLLTGSDTASVSAINKAAGTALKSIDVKGGTLTVDTATNLLNATGGKVSITQAVTVGGTAKDTAITATAGTLNTALSGTTTLAKSGTGTLTISRANTHSGKTTVSGGTLKAANKDALGTGAVQLSGGTLEIAANGFANTITSSGTSGITVDSPNTLVLANALSNQGTLTLKGSFDASALKLTQGETTHVDVNGKTGASGFSKSGVTSVTIVSGGTTVNGGTTIIHSELQQGVTLTLGSDGKATASGEVDYSSYLLTGSDTASVSAINKKAGKALKSIDVTGGILTVDAATNVLNASGGKVKITGSSTVGGSIAGTRIETTGGTINAAISGSSNIDVTGGGKVVIDRANTYTGDTWVFENGVLRVSNKDALGSSKVYLSCGTLEVACNELANTVTSTCSNSVLSVADGYTLKLTQDNAISNQGTITLQGRFDASALELGGSDTRIDTSGNAGDSGFALRGARSVTIVTGGITKDGGAVITHSGMQGAKFTLGKNGVATTEGTMDYTSYLLTGEAAAKVSAINTMAGGKLKSIEMAGGTLTVDADAALKDATGGAIRVTAAAKLSVGGSVDSVEVKTQGGAQGNSGELLYGDDLTLSGMLYTGSLTLTQGNIKGGSINVGGATTVQQGCIATDIVGKTLEKTGSKRVELKGANKFDAVTVSAGQLALLEGGSMTADVTVKSGAALLTAVNVAGDIKLEANADMHLRPGTTYDLRHALTSTTGAEFHGNLAAGSGAVLTLNCTGTAAALTVHGNINLKNGSSATASGSWVTGTTYTLLKAVDGSLVNNSGKDLNQYFDLEKGTYKLVCKDNAITLVKGTVSQALQRMAGSRVAAGAGDFTLEDAPIAETLATGVADALVQADWGAVHAGRAFNTTLNGRHQSLRAICNGRTAVWVNAIGSSARQSSAHGHAGADHNLYGGVFGVEFNAGAHGAAGVAIGHTWNRVSTFGANRLKQDSQHAGAFGRARVASNGANSLWLEASASYGKTDSRGTLGASRERWSQDGCTLNVHANDVWQVNDETAVNFFGGLEYAATDSGRIEDLRTGSVQNLRGEIGAGVTRTVGRGMMFAEAALTGDMVRHNPQADVGIRRGGANPGRIGGSITVGGAYILNAHWSLNATYTFEGAKHNNSHNASAGATFRF